MQAGGLAAPVVVKKHVVLGADVSKAVHEIDHLLVVTIEKIYLETLDTHCGIVFDNVFHVTFDGMVSSP